MYEVVVRRVVLRTEQQIDDAARDGILQTRGVFCTRLDEVADCFMRHYIAVLILEVELTLSHFRLHVADDLLFPRAEQVSIAQHRDREADCLIGVRIHHIDIDGEGALCIVLRTAALRRVGVGAVDYYAGAALLYFKLRALRCADTLHRDVGGTFLHGESDRGRGKRCAHVAHSLSDDDIGRIGGNHPAVLAIGAVDDGAERLARHYPS